MCDMSGEGTPILTISISAGGHPAMPPGYDMAGGDMNMAGDDAMDMQPTRATAPSSRAMSAMKELKPKREMTADRKM